MTKSPLLISAFALCIGFTACSDSGSSTSETTDRNESEVSADAIPSGAYYVDKDNSVVEWQGTMIGVYSHTGTANFQDGKLAVVDGKITDASFIVDMNSLVATDENYSPEEGNSKERLIEHLQSDDFFLVSEYPVAVFDLNNIDGNTATGTMTIRGTQGDVTVNDLNVHAHEGELHITGDLTFDRQHYGVAFTHPLQEMVLANDIELKIDITATQQ